MKKNIGLLLLTLAFASNALAQSVDVNLNSTQQVIRGFGAINHPVWYSDLNAQERELAFGNGPGQRSRARFVSVEGKRQ